MCPPTPGLRGQGTSPGSPAGFLGSSGQGKRPPLLSCSSGLGGPLQSASPGLPDLPPMPPRTHTAWRRLWRAGDRPGSSARSLCPSVLGNRPPLIFRSSRRAPPACLSWSPQPPSCASRTQAAWMGLWSGGTGLGAQQAPWPEWARRSPFAPLPLFPESPSRLPLLVSLASGAAILSGLHFSSTLRPLHPTDLLWGSSCLPGHQSPPPVAGRSPNCGETLTPWLPTLPS